MLLYLRVEILGERLIWLNLYEVSFIMFSARTITCEILENMLLHLRAGDKLIVAGFFRGSRVLSRVAGF